MDGSDHYARSVSGIHDKAKVQTHQLAHLQQHSQTTDSLTVWLDESTVTTRTDNSSPERRGHPLHYTDTAITTALMMKRVFNLSLRVLQVLR